MPSFTLDPVVRALAPIAKRLPSRGDHVVVKTVLSLLSLEWIVSGYQPQVVIIERNELNVVASWLALDIPMGELESPAVLEVFARPLGMPEPDPLAPKYERVAWCVGMLTRVVREAVSRHPEWYFVSHAQLCADPMGVFGPLFAAVGLQWTDHVRKHIAASDTMGTSFETRRVRAELAEAWRSRLSIDEERGIRSVLEWFPVGP
jgi:hypothetical protein